jgi:hypothetical protein
MFVERRDEGDMSGKIRRIFSASKLDFSQSGLTTMAMITVERISSIDKQHVQIINRNTCRA